MRARFWIVLSASPFLAGWGDRGPPWPHVGPMPDDPAAGPRLHYQTITAGTKSYRPVEPLPWDDMMRRIMPPGAKPPPEQKEKSAPEQEAPQQGR